MTPVFAKLLRHINIDRVLLVCMKGPTGRFLQLQLYKTEEGFLASAYDHSAPPKGDPRAAITIDGERFPVALVLGENYAALGDEPNGRSPKVSDRLLRSLEAGKIMKLHTDLLVETAGPQSPGKAQAMRAMRRV